MKIVIDSESSRFRAVKRWFICLVIWFVMMVISGIIARQTGWDTDFFEGYFSCVMVGYATGLVRRL